MSEKKIDYEALMVQPSILQMSILYELSSLPTMGVDMERFFQIVVEKCSRLLQVERVAIFSLEEPDILLPRKSFGFRKGEISKIRLEKSLLRRACKERKFQVFSPGDKDVQSDPFLSKFPFASAISLPLRGREKITGMLFCARKFPKPFSPEEIRLFNIFASRLEMSWENIQLYADLQRKVKEMNLMQVQLIQSAKLASLGELAASVAHEINNPLTNVLGFTSLLLEQMPEGDPRREDLKIVEEEALRTRNIVKNLMEFSRQSRMEKEERDLNEIIRETLSLMRQEIKLSNINLIERYEEKLPPLLLNPNQIKQVFFNIIRNSLEAMPEEGTLLIETSRKRKTVRVTFTDTGRGIPQENLSRIFEPFFTTKEEGKGVGLGLSVSKGIMEEHGGSIEVSSKVGRGSTFFLNFSIGAKGKNENSGRG